MKKITSETHFFTRLSSHFSLAFSLSLISLHTSLSLFFRTLLEYVNEPTLEEDGED